MPGTTEVQQRREAGGGTYAPTRKTQHGERDDTAATLQAVNTHPYTPTHTHTHPRTYTHARGAEMRRCVRRRERGLPNTSTGRQTKRGTAAKNHTHVHTQRQGAATPGRCAAHTFNGKKMTAGTLRPAAEPSERGHTPFRRHHRRGPNGGAVDRVKYFLPNAHLVLFDQPFDQNSTHVFPGPPALPRVAPQPSFEC